MPQLGKVGLVNRGDYSPSAVYNILDFVYYDGSSYICLQNGTSAVTPNNEGLYWRYLAKGYIADTSVFCRKADMKTSLTTTYTAGQYAADAAALKTLNDKIKSYTASSPISISDSNVISLAVSGAVNSTTSFGETGNKTPAFGGTFKVPSFTVDKWGRLTVAADHNVTVPTITNSVFPEPESGVITWSPSTFATSSNVSSVYKVGTLAILNLDFLSSGDYSSGGYINMGTLPTGFKPVSTLAVNIPANTLGTKPVCVQLGTSGAINIMNYKGSDHLGVRAQIPYYIP